MAEKLSVQIALDGGAEIERQLADIGAAGQKAFADIIKSAEQAGGFRQLDLTEVTKKLERLGTVGPEAINKITAAVTAARRLETVSSAVQEVETRFSSLRTTIPAVGQAFANLFRASDKAGDAFKTVGVRASEARAGVNALAQGLNAMGAGPAGRAATVIANIGTRFGALAVAAAAVGALSAALIKFAAAAVETEKALTQLQAVSSQSFVSLSALSNAFAQGGTSVKKFATEFGNLSEKIASAGEAAAKQQAIAQQAEDAAKGLKVTELGAITLDERVKALLETLSRVPAEEQWFRLADIFKSLGNDAERARIGKALGLSPETIATLSQGSDKLRQLAQEAQRLGIALDAVDQKNLQGLIASQNTAGGLFDALKEKMGALVAPAISSFWEGFTARLSELIPVFTQIASSIGQMDFSSVGAAAADFLAIIAKIAAGWTAMISGQVSLKDVLGQMLQQAGQIAVDIGVAIGTGIIQGIISSIQAGIGSVWAAIKQALGSGGSPIAGGAGGGIGGAASGGLLGGRGTGTSDSNLAWLSRGEYVMPASAVRQPGVLALLEALRRSGRIPGFAEGGAVGGNTGGGRTSGDELWNFLNQITDQLDRALRSLVKDLVNHVLIISKDVEQPMHALLGLMRDIKGKASGGLLGGRGTGTSDSNLAWLSRGEYVMPASAVRQPGVLALLEALRRSGRIPGFQEGGLSSGPNFPQGGWPFSGFGDEVKQLVQLGKENNTGIKEIDWKVSKASDECAQHSQEIENDLDIFWDALLKSSQGKNTTGLASGFNMPQWPFAAGGLMGGRGTGTSDSNLAWLSRGEHIMPAWAVRQPGVLSFLEALRRSGGNLSRVLDGMGRFALGGMVPRAIPAFATGGLAGGSNVTIQFPGLPAIGGLRASSDVVDQLHKAAALAQVRSGGRKPSRYS